jgi:hypothetical protein
MTTASAPGSVRQQLDRLAEAVGRPIVTVYLPTPSAIEDAPQQLDIRRRNLARALGEAGVDDEVVARIDEVIADHEHGEGEALVLVADDASLLYQGVLVRPLERELVRVGPAPALLPALRAEQDDLYHVAVLLDREGADIWVRPGLGDPETVTSVDGSTEHIHRGHPGGWSQRRFQQRAEETWEANAGLVVEELRQLVDLDRIDAIVVAGDVRAVGGFTEKLPGAARERLIEVDGSRQADTDAFLDAADVAIRTAARDDEVGDIRQLRSELGGDNAVEGLEVLSLLAQGRVERLFVADDTEAEDRLEVPFTVEPLLAGPMAEELSATEHGPAADLAVLLARRMGTDIHVLPSVGARNPRHGLGARLRG